MSGRVKDGAQMIAQMRPELGEEVYVFCTVSEGYEALIKQALASFQEPEGLSLIVETGAAEAAGLDVSQPMRRITLMVNSALDGVGLTAAVAGALAGAGIACNMVAANHHDHAFVPAEDAERALAVLRALSAQHSEKEAQP